MAKEEGSSAKGFLLILAVAAGFGAYWFWPSGIGDVPLSHLTLGMIGSAALSIFCGLVALAFIGGAFD